MKRLFLVTAYILVVGSLFAQAPESFKYQAAIRDSEGNMLSETSISLKISIIQNSTEGNIVYSESHSTQSNNNGLVNINIGEGSVLSGDFNAVPWADGPFFIHIEVDPEGGNNYTDMGYSELKSVPYALYAENVSNTDDADADPQNEIQDLTLEGNILTITLNNNPTAIDLSPYLDNTDDQILNLNNDQLTIKRGNTIDLPYDSSYWSLNNNNIYYTDGNVGIGVTHPRSKLEVKGGESSTETDTLFSVKDKKGNVVFAVFPDGAKVYVNESLKKGPIGGFAVSGRNTSKATKGEYDVLRITPDSTRFYVNNSAKGPIGGFAVSGRNTQKGITNDIFFTNQDSTRIYFDQNVKGPIGGFAVSGRNTSKGVMDQYFNVSGSSTADKITPSKPMVLWYPKKEAFLTGRVLIESPDSVGTNALASGFESKSVGDYSQALGYMPVARGNYSTAIGNSAISHGNSSFSFGDNAQALAEGSYAIGTFAKATGLKSFSLGSSGKNHVGTDVEAPVASGDYSYAFGMGSIASGFGSYALGLNAKATNQYSFSFGNATEASGASSLALGDGSVATEWYGIAMGEGARSYGEGAVSIGQSTTAIGDHSYCFSTSGTTNGYYSAAIGSHVNTNSRCEIAVGSYNDMSPFPGSNSWNGLDPIFVVGNGQAEDTRSNAFVVLKSGKVGIGTSTPGEKLTVYNGTSTGTYTTSGWLHSSDRRLKTNIKPISSSLDNILKLQGVFFNWKSDMQKREIGLIAQDVEQTLPEVVSKNSNGYYSIAYGNLSAVIIEAMKEQQKIIETQKEKITDLEDRILKLEKLIMEK